MKDLWFDEMERRRADLIDQGVSEDEAYERACDSAYDGVRERFADAADAERKRRKEEG